MNFTPMSDDEIDTAGLIPEGTVCHAEVTSSEKYISNSSGKESIRVILNVFHEDNTFQMYVYLTPAYMKLFKHAVQAMVSQQDYESGNIDAQSFENKLCDVLIGFDEYKGQKKNVIVDFFKPKSSNRQSVPNSANAIDESLPF